MLTKIECIFQFKVNNTLSSIKLLYNNIILPVNADFNNNLSGSGLETSLYSLVLFHLSVGVKNLLKLLLTTTSRFRRCKWIYAACDHACVSRSIQGCSDCSAGASAITTISGVNPGKNLRVSPPPSFPLLLSLTPTPSLPPRSPSSSLSSPCSTSHLPFHSHRSRSPEIQLEGLGERCKLPQRGLGGASAEVELGVFSPSNLTAGVNNVNDFSEIQPTQFCAL